MSRPISSLWYNVPSDLASRIERCIDMAYEQKGHRGPKHVFFRADDVAVPGNKLSRLMELFTRHGVPLSLAVVPAWLTRPRWQQLRRMGQKSASLWSWHQHGWRHINHERTGKKQEFGGSRSPDRIREDLVRGRKRLEKLMAREFYPLFVPPWNRCSLDTLELLKELKYAAISRGQGSRPLPPDGLPDIFVNVDLHTRKAKNPQMDWKQLLRELGMSIATGHCGVMIHHQLMNDAAFDVLNVLLKIVSQKQDLHLINLKHLSKII